MTIAEIISLNQKRLQEINTPYNPISGEGCFSCERKEIFISDYQYDIVRLPIKMFDEPLVKAIEDAGSFADTAIILSQKTDSKVTAENVGWAFVKLRIKYDFEFWAATFIKIKPKAKVGEDISGDCVPFILNRGQRKYLKIILDMWFNNKPIRIILLKARQWGGSTLTQIFMMWIQLIHKKQWNSVICAHVEPPARTIRGMYTIALENYPYILDDEAVEKLCMKPYEGSAKTRIVPSRGCRITIGSAEKPEGLRGEDLSLAHFSEVSSFPSTEGKKPEDLIQSIVSGIPPVPCSMIVYESTAKGVGNFFHTQWILAKQRKSAFTPVFVAWFDIESYSKPIDDYNEFIESLTEEEKLLFECGATLEHIAWYREKGSEITDKWRFVSEFPSNDIEAFQSTGSRYFNLKDVHNLRKTCHEPALVADIISDADYGEQALEGIKINANPQGHFSIWALPDDIKMYNNRYVVVVDVNRGISSGADNGIITVFDRYWMGAEMGGKPEVVAEWSGHIIVRYFIWIAVKIAKLYNDAFLVIESNTPNSIQDSGFIMASVFEEIADVYTNMYYRQSSPEDIRLGKPKKWGFNTNRTTKTQICTHHQVVLANDMYVERSLDAVNEHDTFEVKLDGTIGAVDGCNDDRVITRALGCWICYKALDPPIFADDRKLEYSTTTTIVNESTL
jgi:hypothetical protein